MRYFFFHFVLFLRHRRCRRCLFGGVAKTFDVSERKKKLKVRESVCVYCAFVPLRYISVDLV